MLRFIDFSKLHYNKLYTKNERKKNDFFVVIILCLVFILPSHIHIKIHQNRSSFFYYFTVWHCVLFMFF